ncbi:MAG: ATP-dependent RNA helicase RhlB, partial [Thalassolituus sp.]
MLKKFFNRKGGNTPSAPAGKSAAKSTSRPASKSTASPQSKGSQSKGPQSKSDNGAGKKRNNNSNAHGGKRQSHQKTAQAVPETPWSLADFQVEPAEGKTRFHDLQLPDSVMRGIHDQGFQYC